MRENGGGGRCDETTLAVPFVPLYYKNGVVRAKEVNLPVNTT